MQSQRQKSAVIFHAIPTFAQQWRRRQMRCHRISHIIEFHVIQFHVIQFHIIQFHIIQFHIIQSQNIKEWRVFSYYHHYVIQEILSVIIKNFILLLVLPKTIAMETCFFLSSSSLGKTSLTDCCAIWCSFLTVAFFFLFC